jgi:hypothetical protein
MKEAVLMMLILLLITNISAIRINEVELNPEGADSGNEWIELYHKGDFDLRGYKLVNNDGDEIEMGGSFSKYYIYVFSKQWLDNTDEKVFLYKEGELVDETDLFDDEENNGKTWQFCDGNWEFVESTEKKKNDCEEEEQEEIFEEIEKTDSEVKEIVAEQKEPEIIVLDSKDIKSSNNKKSLSKGDYAMYGFVGFCVLLGLLFIIRKKRFNKNEFE